MKFSCPICVYLWLKFLSVEQASGQNIPQSPVFGRDAQTDRRDAGATEKKKIPSNHPCHPVLRG
jgi:hypothetical protein